MYKTMFLFLKAAKNQRVCAKLRQSKTLPWRLKAKGERPVIGIKLSQSYHPTLAAKQAQGRGGGPNNKPHCSNCCVSLAVQSTTAAAVSLHSTSKGPD